MAFRKQKINSNQPFAAGDSDLSKQVHVMPQRFYSAPKKKNTGLIIIIILAGFLIVGGLGAVAYFLNQSLNQAKISNDIPAPSPVSDEVNENVNDSPAINEPVTPEINAGAGANLATATPPLAVPPATTTPIADVNMNIDVQAEAEPAAGAILPLAFDQDGDNLTTLEEALFGTDPAKADTDNDNFPDGEEILNNYDPTRAKVTLANSGLVSSYSTALFSLVYPKIWRIKEQAADKTEVLFISPQGEFFEVLVLDNAKKLSLPEWYPQQYPRSDFGILTAVAIGGLSGYRSPDERTYYFISRDQSQVFLISYNAGGATELNYAAAFVMMVKNFKIAR